MSLGTAVDDGERKIVSAIYSIIAPRMITNITKLKTKRTSVSQSLDTKALPDGPKLT